MRFLPADSLPERRRTRLIDPAGASTADRYAEIKVRLAEACRRAGRRPSEVTVVGACKRQPLERIVEAVDAGLGALGENQVQEAREHRAALARSGHAGRVEWRLIGPLQANKAAPACEVFDVFEAIDRVRIAERLERVLARRQSAPRSCLLELNIGREASKHGFLPDQKAEMLGLAELAHLRIRGLMAIPPNRASAEESRADFAALRRLRDELGRRGLFGDREGLLSMGMSADFEAAIQEGATHIRIGTALFGPRIPR